MCRKCISNPIPHFAGDLVEKQGFVVIGLVELKSLKCMAILLLMGASAQDVLSLIELIKHTIKDKFDVDMHTEVEIIGR